MYTAGGKGEPRNEPAIAPMPSAASSWWPCWQQWLAERSAPPAGLPGLGAPEAGYPVLGEAPGHYVHET